MLLLLILVWLNLVPVKLNSILNDLALKWINESSEPPYIESISGYFPISVMKKKNNN